MFNPVELHPCEAISQPALGEGLGLGSASIPSIKALRNGMALASGLQHCPVYMVRPSAWLYDALLQEVG